jgi:hypothetical protein
MFKHEQLSVLKDTFIGASDIQETFWHIKNYGYKLYLLNRISIFLDRQNNCCKGQLSEKLAALTSNDQNYSLRFRRQAFEHSKIVLE